MVQDLYTMLLATNTYPSLSDCAMLANALIKAYPFLADKSDQPHVR